MTKTEIIAELRRSVNEDNDPWYDMAQAAFWASAKFCSGETCDDNNTSERTFFLLVACALESE